MGYSRRSFLAAGAASGAAIWLPDSVRLADAATRAKVPLATSGGFSTGVMSGDPAPNAVTLWSRLDGQEASRLRVTVEVAKDQSFNSVVLRRSVPIAKLRDWTCKIRVGGLQPDTRYWFRFATKDGSSPVGRTQTAPPPDSQRPIRIAYFSCQDFSSGFYGVYAKLLDLEPDVVVCGGDYIYDRIYSDSGYGGVREDKAGVGPDSVATSISHYRAKYRLYRTDPDLKELHRLVPLVAQWDDHEVTDNYVGTKDKEDMPDDGAEADKFDRSRILSGWRAWHEYMPALRFGKSYRNYRNFRYGKNVELYMLDSRSYRDDQPCGGGTFVACDDDAPRKFLGPEQASWFKDGLLRSDANWKVVGNQMMIMPFDVAGPLQVEVDSWSGYRHERNDICTHIKSKGIKNVVFLTGDIHTFFAGEVREFGREGEPIGVEFVGGSTTSPGTSQTISNVAGGGVLPPDIIRGLTDLVPVTNPWMNYAETRSHGAAFFQVSTAEVAAQYLAMRDVTTKEGAHDVRVLQRFRVASGTPRIEVG